MTAPPAGGGPAERTEVAFDGLQEVAEYDGTGASAPERTLTTTRRLDEVLSTRDASEGWRSHHGDLIQSGTLSVGSGGGAETARYRAYGASLEGSPGQWGFAGRPEELGGLVPLRARTYAPALGAFLSSDPLNGYEGMPQTQVDYGYAAGAPSRWSDPRGTHPLVVALIIAAILIVLLVFVFIAFITYCQEKLNEAIERAARNEWEAHEDDLSDIMDYDEFESQARKHVEAQTHLMENCTRPASLMTFDYVGAFSVIATEVAIFADQYVEDA